MKKYQKYNNHIKTNLLIILCISVSLNLFSQPKEDSTSRILQKIIIQKCSNCLYDIIYENKSYKFYFDKTQFLTFANSELFKNNIDVRYLVKYIDATQGFINFSDPYWEINKNSSKYGIEPYDINDINNPDTSNYPRVIIDRNKFLKYSEIFVSIIREYLINGELKIFNKNQDSFVNSDTIYLVGFSGCYETEQGYSKWEGEAYQLPDGARLLERFIKMAHSSKINPIIKNAD